jgi:pSer/pThr/pTyr-binding forkhead associated (FHA) protein
MPFAIVTITIEYGDTVELPVALDVPSRTLAMKILRDLGRTMRRGVDFDLFIDTGHGDKPIDPAATLGELGIEDGQRLRIKRAVAGGPEPAGGQAYLRAPSGDLLPLDSSYVIIGRKDAEYEVPLDLDLAKHDPAQAVSRRHACISREAGKYSLLDLGSTNGTRLNEVDLIPNKKVPLKDGDRIEFGRGLRVRFTVSSADGAAPGSA